MQETSKPMEEDQEKETRTDPVVNEEDPSPDGYSSGASRLGHTLPALLLFLSALLMT